MDILSIKFNEMRGNIMNLDLIASELSMVIFENDNISQNKVGEKLREYIENHFKLLPCHIDYVIDKAYEIYEKI